MRGERCWRFASLLHVAQGEVWDWEGRYSPVAGVGELCGDKLE